MFKKLSRLAQFLGVEAVLFIFIIGCTAKHIGQPTAEAENLHKQALASFAKPFLEIRNHYFSMLDHHGSDSNRSRAIGAFASKLSTLAEEVNSKLSHGEIASDPDRQLAGLILTYDALMNINNSLGVMDGELKLSDVRLPGAPQSRRHESKAELATRFKNASNELAQAKKLRPDDERIDGWQLVPIAGLDILKQGKTAPNTLQSALDLNTRPSFNMGTTVVLFKYENASSGLFKKILLKMKGFVDAYVKDGTTPCKDYPRDCKNRFFAPYNIEVSRVFIGDVFLRQAEQLLVDGDIAGATQMNAYAKNAYNAMNYEVPSSELLRWFEQPMLKARLDYLKKLDARVTPKPSAFQQTSAYKVIYQCASCHGRVSENNSYRKDLYDFDQLDSHLTKAAKTE